MLSCWQQAEAKHLEAQALLASSRAQLDAAKKGHASLQGQIQQGLAAIYNEVRSLQPCRPSISQDLLQTLFVSGCEPALAATRV